MKLSKKIILASASPRRKEILKNAGFHFEVLVKPTDEAFPLNLPPAEVPIYLAKLKINEFKEHNEEYLIIAADTVVIYEGEIFNKPKDTLEAIEMLKKLSGKKHTVITGVCFKVGKQLTTFSDVTEVYFKELTQSEIAFYVESYKPFDKAGAYGVQEFIGMIGVEKLNGSFYNVMGLPIHKVYTHLKPYIVF